MSKIRNLEVRGNINGVSGRYTVVSGNRWSDVAFWNYMNREEE